MIQKKIKFFVLVLLLFHKPVGMTHLREENIKEQESSMMQWCREGV